MSTTNKQQRQSRVNIRVPKMGCCRRVRVRGLRRLSLCMFLSHFRMLNRLRQGLVTRKGNIRHPSPTSNKILLKGLCRRERLGRARD